MNERVSYFTVDDSGSHARATDAPQAVAATKRRSSAR